MTQYITLAGALAVLLLAGAAEAGAQAITSPFEWVEERHSVGAFFGHLSTQRGRVGQGPHSAPIIGARYTLRFTGPLSGEASLAGIPTRRTVLSRPAGAADTIPPVALGEADMVLLLAEAGVRFTVTGQRTWHGLAPYATATGGIRANVSGAGELNEAIAEEQRVPLGPGFALGVGAGTSWFLTDRVSLQVDARDYLWRLTVPGGLTGTGTRQTNWAHNLALTIGGAVHF
jgi:hypothetical protein